MHLQRLERQVKCNILGLHKTHKDLTVDNTEYDGLILTTKCTRCGQTLFQDCANRWHTLNQMISAEAGGG